MFQNMIPIFNTRFSAGGRKKYKKRRKTRRIERRRKRTRTSRKSKKSKGLLVLEPQLWNKVKLLNKNNVNIKQNYFYLYNGKPVTGGSANPWYVVTKKNIKKGQKYYCHFDTKTYENMWKGSKIPYGLRLLTKTDVLNIAPNYKF